MHITELKLEYQTPRSFARTTALAPFALLIAILTCPYAILPLVDILQKRFAGMAAYDDCNVAELIVITPVVISLAAAIQIAFSRRNRKGLVWCVSALMLCILWLVYLQYAKHFMDGFNLDP
jgi:hypothetical protein